LNNVLIIANRLQERLALISLLQGKYFVETWQEPPKSFQAFRDMNIDGLVLFVENNQKALQFCTKLHASQFKFSVCLYDKNQRIKNPMQYQEKLGVIGYWGGKLSNDFSGFLEECCNGKITIHKTQTRMNRFLDIISKRNRER
jgi:hypothetical protein